MTDLRALRLSRGRVVLTSQGLRVGNTLQVFTFERSYQEAFARLACQTPGDVLNVGFGLGFAQLEFQRHQDRHVHLVEFNPALARSAQRLARDPCDKVLVASWQDILPGRVPHGVRVIYFDAFPVEADFNYSPRAFRRYLDPFIAAAVQTPELRAAFFVTFDTHPIRFASPTGWHVERVLSRPLPQRARRRMVSRMSLYKLHPGVQLEVAGT